jgi:ribosomal-protein-alanine N-acetyltransferase
MNQFSDKNLKLLIRAAVSADLPALMTLERHATTAACWPSARYEALFHDANCNRVALVIEEKQVQGFIIAGVVGLEWEIENMAIAASVRRRGLGTRLLGELLDMARARGAESVFLEVRRSNPARALYEKYLFVESGRRRKYYKDPEEDAVLYRLVLN